MNLKSSGVFSSIIVLICLILVCHIANYLYPKQNYKNNQKNRNNFLNMNLAIPSNPAPTQYNMITYDNHNNQSLCSQKNEAEIPCKLVKTCPKPTPYQLSDSELAVVYRDAYNSAGRELILRTLKDETYDTK